MPLTHSPDWKTAARAALYLALPLLLLLACAPAPDAQAPLATETATSAPSSTPLPTEPALAATPTPDGPSRLVVWWPEPLAPLDNETAADVLSQQLSAFQRENEGISVQFRLKKVEDVGGIMSTLRAASAVAPRALPDLTLIRRDDLRVAVQQGLVYPLGERLSPAVIEDMQPVGLDLGMVGGVLYGVPYTLDLLHLAYPESVGDVEAWRYDTLLEEQIPFVFPAGRANGINNVLLLQYLAAGGTISDTGALEVDADALRQTLAFYEQAMETGVVDAGVLEYVVPSDYRDLLLEDAPVAAVVNSTLYLQLTDQGLELGVGPIATADGTPLTMVNGWMWVLTTPDADRQARAIRFLNWMLDASRQADYTRIIHMLPSQRTALRQSDRAGYVRFIGDLLPNAVLPLTESESGAAARAMQSALAAVLTGQQTADSATQAVLNQLNS